MKGISLAIALSLLSCTAAPQISQAKAIKINQSAVSTQQQRYQEAEAVWQRIVSYNPGNAEAHYNLGIAQAQQEKWESALASYDRAIALNPTFANAHCNKGRTLVKLQQFEAAGQAYRLALRLDPKDSFAKELLQELDIIAQHRSNEIASLSAQ